MDNRSISEIREDINNNLKKLGKLIILKNTISALSIVSILLSIVSFIFIFVEIYFESNALDPGIACIIFMIFSLLCILFYVEIDNTCKDIKRIIHNDERIIRRLTK